MRIEIRPADTGYIWWFFSERDNVIARSPQQFATRHIAHRNAMAFRKHLTLASSVPILHADTDEQR